jgi:hypothetical protein
LAKGSFKTFDSRRNGSPCLVPLLTRALGEVFNRTFVEA